MAGSMTPGPDEGTAGEMADEMQMRLRYPTALDLPAEEGPQQQPRAASAPGRRRAPAQGARRAAEEGSAPSKEPDSGSGVKLDRRVFRKLRRRRPGSEPAATPTRRGTRLGARRTKGVDEVPEALAGAPMEPHAAWGPEPPPPARSRASCRAAQQQQSSYCAAPRGGSRYEEQPMYEDAAPPFVDYEEIRRLARLGAATGTFGADMLDYPSHQDMGGYDDFSRGQRSSFLGQPSFAARSPPGREVYEACDGYGEPWGGPDDAWLYSTPERGAAGAGCGRGYIYTPPKRAPMKTDPVSRGAQFRATWGQDRFLKNTGTRKFDLRGCGSPGSCGARSSSRSCGGSMFVPDYVPPHEKRRDALRFQVRQHLLLPEDL